MIYQVINKNKEIINFLKKKYAIRIKNTTVNTFIDMLMLYSNLQNYNISYIINGSFLDKLIKEDKSCLQFLEQNKQFLHFIFNKQDITKAQKEILDKYSLKFIEFDKDNLESKFFMTFKNYKK